MRIEDKIEVEYLIQSNIAKSSGKWYTTLHAKSVEKIVVNKEIENQQKLM